MSTDIGALEKQYAKLRRKQHHACVVISGIKPGRADTDVKLEKENPGNPNVPEIPADEDNLVEGSVAMLTLSVPLETEKSYEDLTDPISPTIFGDTKCFFVQNLKKKKTKDKHHTKHSKRSDKHGNKIKSDSDKEDGADDKQYKTDQAENNSNNKGKRVCFSDEVKEVGEAEQEDKASEENMIQDNTVNKENCEENHSDTEIETQSKDEKDDLKGIRTSTEETYEKSVCMEQENAENDVVLKSEGTKNSESVEIDSKTVNRPDYDNNEKAEEKSKLSDNMHKEDSIDIPAEFHSNNLKTSRSQGLRNPAVRYSKQYYPSSHKQISHKKQRTNSESVGNTSQQSIYQHFTMTKRQLSLDSAMSGERNKAMPAKTLEFPFPVHSINQHKIKAGMKLGLYDQKALEKMEKTRKIPKSKLPNLTFD